jgi:hypothetical protein
MVSGATGRGIGVLMPIVLSDRRPEPVVSISAIAATLTM